jgi:hypothetical protein
MEKNETQERGHRENKTKREERTKQRGRKKERTREIESGLRAHADTYNDNIDIDTNTHLHST